jgi:hypothetical protein
VQTAFNFARAEGIWKGGDVACCFLTSALDGSGGQFHAPAASPPSKDPFAPVE